MFKLKALKLRVQEVGFVLVRSLESVGYHEEELYLLGVQRHMSQAFPFGVKSFAGICLYNMYKDCTSG